ncbi:unnamed protein product [Didymodactylos carnosus]|uniref:NADAR domain-containing protein n=1 Tax=Didymodactylos carnosus TaxID=1234261 RepID=A0A815YKJ6_9BILA|nr:unnamed protein product [Didymodactylos carnosus]CAF1572976.1 unnamed protein product [Didymodactylos carnosus]CAF4260994.1 unnamed protein product [Didymodactylos carnosus]CAF4436884.1 unnamed protein product [Didymodactylos carnosus]
MGGPSFIDGKCHEETNNFQACRFEVDGIEYCSAENYFQTQKGTTTEAREKVRNSGPGAACYMAGSYVHPLRPDWESVKVQVMYDGNKAKFEQNSEFAKALMSTKGDVRFGSSTTFWNTWNGLIMERIRAELRRNGPEDEETVKRIKELMDKYQRDNEM